MLGMGNFDNFVINTRVFSEKTVWQATDTSDVKLLQPTT